MRDRRSLGLSAIPSHHARQLDDGQRLLPPAAIPLAGTTATAYRRRIGGHNVQGCPGALALAHPLKSAKALLWSLSTGQHEVDHFGGFLAQVEIEHLGVVLKSTRSWDAD